MKTLFLTRPLNLNPDVVARTARLLTFVLSARKLKLPPPTTDTQTAQDDQAAGTGCERFADPAEAKRASC